METQKDIFDLLELISLPAFCLREHSVLYANAAAQALTILPGMPLNSMLETGQEEYADFRQGTLMLTITCCGCSRSASVSRVGDLNVFVLDEDRCQPELTSLALASRELRDPLSTIMLTLDKVLPLASQEDSARIHRGIYQILRILGNMSDAAFPFSRQEMVNVTSQMAELFEKAAAILPGEITLHYQGPDMPIYMLADSQQLERAVWNLLSNSLKFMDGKGRIEATLTRKDRRLQLCIQDTGSGVPQELMGSLFSRYLRQPTVEDRRYGIGLGMVLVRSAAANHGGTVLIDQPQGQGTRVTMTLAIRQGRESLLRCPILRADYCGERDHALVELSQSLPLDYYRKD